MPLYTPDELLPIYPTYSTVIKNGVKYKAYFETDWHQVMTEDGVPLCELIQSMPTFSTTNFYKYCGTFKSSPSQTAIEQLYALNSQNNGDVYLVETDMVTDEGRVCEAYVWLGNEAGWVYCGTTNRKASLNRDLPNVVKLLPSEIGEPNQVMVVSKDGKSIVWGDYSFDTHNEDPEAHQDIRNELDLKADRLIIYNDTLESSYWSYNGAIGAFEYIYRNDKLPKKAYFELTPVVETPTELKNVSDAGIFAVYRVQYGYDGTPYTILRAKHVPKNSFDVCVKVFGTFIEK